MRMSYLDDAFHRIHKSKNIGNLGDANDTNALIQHLLKSIQIECSFSRHGNDTKVHALTLAKHLPRNDIGMMLHRTDDDFISFVTKSLTETECQEIDALGGATGEKYFRSATSIDKTTYRLARSLMEFGSLLAEEMNTAMHIGIHVVVFLRNRLHHTTRLLGGGSIVEINQRLAIHRARKDGKVRGHSFRPSCEGGNRYTARYIIFFINHCSLLSIYSPASWKGARGAMGLFSTYTWHILCICSVRHGNASQ